MKVSYLSILLTGMLCATASAQMYNTTFRGVAYAQEASGNLVPTPLTELSLIEAAAEYRTIPTNNLVLVYHLESTGDSLKVVDKLTGDLKIIFCVFTFGTSLGRSAVTNTAGTEIRGVEYVYTGNNTRWSTWNDHSMGAVVLNKRIMSDGSGNLRYSIDGQHMQWCALPNSTRSALTCWGSFTTGTEFTPGSP